MTAATLLVALATATGNKAEDDSAASCHWYGFECSAHSDCCTDGDTPSCCDGGFCQGGSVCNAIFSTDAQGAADIECVADFDSGCMTADDCCTSSFFCEVGNCIEPYERAQAAECVEDFGLCDVDGDCCNSPCLG